MKDRTFLDGFAKIRNIEFDPYSFMYSGSRVRVQVSVYEFWKNNGNHLIFAKPSKNVLSFIFVLILDAVLVCHVIWVIGFESGVKKIDYSRRYWVKKWEIRYLNFLLYESLILSQLIWVHKSVQVQKFEYINEYGLPSRTRKFEYIYKYGMATRTRLDVTPFLRVNENQT